MTDKNSKVEFGQTPPVPAHNNAVPSPEDTASAELANISIRVAKLEAALSLLLKAEEAALQRPDQ